MQYKFANIENKNQIEHNNRFFWARCIENQIDFLNNHLKNQISVVIASAGSKNIFLESMLILRDNIFLGQRTQESLFNLES